MKQIKRGSLPLVSVVMPVYNAGRFLAQSIDSVLRQTYHNFEFIIVDDASTDDSWDILEQYQRKDSRIQIYRNRQNAGVSKTVKKAIRRAKGKYLARMDADDICTADRLAKQVSYLEDHPETVALGGQCHVINERGTITGHKTFPTDNADIYRYIYTFVPLQQPTLMIATKRLPRHFEYYHDGMNTAEEIELIFKLFQYGKIENLPDYVLKYRIHSTNTSFKNLRQTFYLTLISRIKAVIDYGYKPRIRDVAVNIAQLIIVSVLPESVILSMYRSIRRLSHIKRTALTPTSPKLKRHVLVHHRLGISG